MPESSSDEDVSDSAVGMAIWSCVYFAETFTPFSLLHVTSPFLLMFIDEYFESELLSILGVLLLT